MAAILQVLAVLLAVAALQSALPIRPAANLAAQGDEMPASESHAPAKAGHEATIHHISSAMVPTLASRLAALSVQPSINGTGAAAHVTTRPHQQSAWNSGLISTMVFGCIASILGILAIWATVWLGLQQIKCITRKSISFPPIPVKCRLIQLLDDDAGRTSLGHWVQGEWDLVLEAIPSEKQLSVIEAPPPAYHLPRVDE